MKKLVRQNADLDLDDYMGWAESFNLGNLTAIVNAIRRSLETGENRWSGTILA